MTLQVGQQVWLYDVNSRGRGPERGTIVKVGSKLITIQYDSALGSGRTRVFRRDHQVANDNYQHQSFKTDEQRIEADRTQAAIVGLREAGLEPTHRVLLSLVQLEAALVAINATADDAQRAANTASTP